MESPSLSLEIHRLGRTIRRYLSMTMSERTCIATSGNARIIMFLDRNREREIVQSDIEERFCITRSTASRVLSLMEDKGLITRERVARDSRLKRIALTSKAEAIVQELRGNADRMEALLLRGFSRDDLERVQSYMRRMRANVDEALEVTRSAGQTKAVRRRAMYEEKEERQ